MKQNVRDYSMAADRALLAGLRDALRRQLARWSISEPVARRFVLVVDEIFNNSIEHGAPYRAEGSRLELRVTRDGAVLELCFVDPDVTADIGSKLGQLLEDARVCPPLDAERGRGLFLIRDTLDESGVAWTAERGLSLTGRLCDGDA